MAKKTSNPRRTKLPKEHWMNDPQEHDFPSAATYLSLVLDPASVETAIAALRQAPSEMRQAKDILRASRLDLLPPNDFHVALDLRKVMDGEKLSPVLLLRGVLAEGVSLTIADGYHRVCASYHVSENAEIPCRIVEVPSVPAKVPAVRGAAPARGATRSRATATKATPAS